MWVNFQHFAGHDCAGYSFPEQEKEALKSKYEMPEEDIYKRDTRPIHRKRKPEEPFDWGKEPELGNRYIPVKKAEKLREEKRMELEAELEKLKEK